MLKVGDIIKSKNRIGSDWEVVAFIGQNTVKLKQVNSEDAKMEAFLSVETITTQYKVK